MQNKPFASQVKGWLIKAGLIVVAAITLAVVASVAFDSGKTTPAATKPPVTAKTTPTQAPVAVEATPTDVPAATSTPEPRQVEVSSQIIKKVGSKHRYFFDIRNRDSEPFSGEVKIKLITARGTTVGSDTFNSTQPITTGLGASVYLDANTGPVAVHGDAGVTKFTYEVLVDDAVVNEGEEQISEKYEAL